MQSNIEKVKEKVLLESLVNKDFDSFSNIFNDIINEQYETIVQNMVNSQMGISNV